MKKITKFTGIFLFILLPLFLNAQIPNPDFENWDSATMTKPSGFRTYGVYNRVSGYKSKYAIRLQRNPFADQGPGAAIYGNPENGFSGGIPAAGRPDSAVGYFKHHLVAGDTGWYLVFFKRKGVLISQDVFYLLVSDSTKFHRLAFKINYTDTGYADSVVVGIASSNPNGNLYGSVLIADSLHFVGGPKKIIIPNGNFEQWQVLGFNTPVGWNSTNTLGAGGPVFPVTKTTDKVFSKYACRIQNVDLGGGQFIPGYIMAGRQGKRGPLPGFKVFGRDSVLYCNYKCTPKNGDTINIAIMMFLHDTMIGMGSFRQWVNVNAWTQVAIPVDYWPAPGAPRIPDSAVIFCAAFQGGQDPKGESVLYVDGLKLNTPMNGVSPKWILPVRIYPNPANDLVMIPLPASFGNKPVVTVFDAAGRIAAAPFEFVQHTVKINTSAIPAGTWYFRLNLDAATYTGSFTINR